MADIDQENMEDTFSEIPEEQLFSAMDLHESLLRALVDMGYKHPSPIQAALIPVALAGKDILGQAKTGTGKTAAFAIPMLERIDLTLKSIQAVVLVPTRELAVQVSGEVNRIADYSQAHALPIYGGQRISQQMHLLKRHPQMVVATPGRMLDLLRRRILDLGSVRYVVLDEVDRMLDIGFRDDIRAILRQITGSHQTIFVSATISDEVASLARQFTTDAQKIFLSRDDLTVPDVEQSYVTAHERDKYRVVKLLLEREDAELVIIFCNTKHGTTKLAGKLHLDGFNAREIHGDLIQSKRERIMERFRKRSIHVLVATDLAARGLDIRDVSHIINYDLPDDCEVYVHRIGRTARMGAGGRAITLVRPDEGKELTKVEKLINKEIPAENLAGFKPSVTPLSAREVVVDMQDTPATQFVPPSNNELNQPSQRPLGGRFKPTRRRRRR